MFTHQDRSIFLTGVLAPPIMVNGANPIKTSSYSVQMQQEINMNPMFMQGGPGKTISEFKGKSVSGDIAFYPRINESNALEDGILDLISVGQNYTEYLSLTSMLIPYNTTITPDNDTAWIPSTNSVVFQYCLVEVITILAKKEPESITITVKITGQTDDENVAQINLPNDENSLYRKLTWKDCFFERDGSQMENATEFELVIKKEIDQTYFLVPYTDQERFDRPFSTGVKSVEVNFTVKENLTNLFDIFKFSLGGWETDTSFSGHFGPISFNIPKCLMKISTQNNDKGLLERKTSGYYQMRPDTPDTNDFLISIT